MSTVNFPGIGLTRPILYMEITQSATASDCSESTSSQPPLKRFQLLAQDMMEHSSSAAVTVSIMSNTVDTELFAYFADCKNYSDKKAVLSQR